MKKFQRAIARTPQNMLIAMNIDKFEEEENYKLMEKKLDVMSRNLKKLQKEGKNYKNKMMNMIDEEVKIINAYKDLYILDLDEKKKKKRKKKREEKLKKKKEEGKNKNVLIDEDLNARIDGIDDSDIEIDTDEEGMELDTNAEYEEDGELGNSDDELDQKNIKEKRLIKEYVDKLNKYEQLIISLKNIIKPELDKIDDKVTKPCLNFIKTCKNIDKYVTERNNSKLDLDRLVKNFKKLNEEETSNEKLLKHKNEILEVKNDFDKYDQKLKEQLPIIFELHHKFMSNVLLNFYNIQFDLFGLWSRHLTEFAKESNISVSETKINASSTAITVTEIIREFKLKNKIPRKEIESLNITHFEKYYKKQKKILKRQYGLNSKDVLKDKTPPSHSSTPTTSDGNATSRSISDNVTTGVASATATAADNTYANISPPTRSAQRASHSAPGSRVTSSHGSNDPELPPPSYNEVIAESESSGDSSSPPVMASVSSTNTNTNINTAATTSSPVGRHSSTKKLGRRSLLGSFRRERRPEAPRTTHVVAGHRSQKPGELSVSAGDDVEVVAGGVSGWVTVQFRGRVGVIPRGCLG